MSIRVEIPNTLSELWELLSYEGARIIAGGTDLMVRIRAKVEKPSLLVDIVRLPEFRLFENREDIFSIGATLTHAELLKKDLPGVLHDAISTIGSPQIRNMGTIGGNICNASPAGDSILPLYLYDANVVLLSKNGERRVPIGEFIKGPGKIDFRKGEALLKIVFTNKYKDYKYIFKKIGKRVAMTISVVSMGLIFKLENDIIKDIKIAYGAVSPTVVRIREAEEYLKGKPIEDKVLEEAKSIIQKNISPIDDIRATGEYRREVAGNLIFLLKDAYGKL